MRAHLVVLRLAVLLAFFVLAPFGGGASACDHPSGPFGRADRATLSEVRAAADERGPGETRTRHRVVRSDTASLPKSTAGKARFCGEECCVAHCLTLAEIQAPVGLPAIARPILTWAAQPFPTGLSPAPDHGPPRFSA